MAPCCLQASVCVPQWAHMPDPWLPVLGPGKAESSHHRRLASFMLGRPGQFSQVLELLWAGDAQMTAWWGRAAAFPWGPQPSTDFPFLQRVHLKAPRWVPPTCPLLGLSPGTDCGAQITGLSWNLHILMPWPPCVSFVQAHPLHRELRREPGAPLAKPAPVQVGRRGLQCVSEDRHPLSALDSPLPPSCHTSFISTFLSLSSMPEFPFISPPPPSLLLFGTYLCVYTGPSSLHNGQGCFLLEKEPVGPPWPLGWTTAGWPSSFFTSHPSLCLSVPGIVPFTLHPPFTGTRRLPGTHVLKGAFTLEVLGP